MIFKYRTYQQSEQQNHNTLNYTHIYSLNINDKVVQEQ